MSAKKPQSAAAAHSNGQSNLPVLPYVFHQEIESRFFSSGVGDEYKDVAVMECAVPGKPQATMHLLLTLVVDGVRSITNGLGNYGRSRSDEVYHIRSSMLNPAEKAFMVLSPPVAGEHFFLDISLSPPRWLYYGQVTEETLVELEAGSGIDALVDPYRVCELFLGTKPMFCDKPVYGTLLTGDLLRKTKVGTYGEFMAGIADLVHVNLVHPPLHDYAVIFDWDKTMADGVPPAQHFMDNSTLQRPRRPMVDLARKYKALGAAVHILTNRQDPKTELEPDPLKPGAAGNSHASKIIQGYLSDEGLSLPIENIHAYVRGASGKAPKIFNRHKDEKFFKICQSGQNRHQPAQAPKTIIHFEDSFDVLASCSEIVAEHRIDCSYFGVGVVWQNKSNSAMFCISAKRDSEERPVCMRQPSSLQQGIFWA